MPTAFKHCRQSGCDLAQNHSYLVKCRRLSDESNDVKNNNIEPADLEVRETVARAMLNNAIKLSQNGDANDALFCYEALVTSFTPALQTATQEIVIGAKFNHQMLKKLIILSA